MGRQDLAWIKEVLWSDHGPSTPSSPNFKLGDGPRRSCSALQPSSGQPRSSLAPWPLGVNGAFLGAFIRSLRGRLKLRQVQLPRSKAHTSWSHRHPTRTGCPPCGPSRSARMRAAICRASFGRRLGFTQSSMASIARTLSTFNVAALRSDSPKDRWATRTRLAASTASACDRKDVICRSNICIRWPVAALWA
ncbi:hypothetical protein ABIA00_003591 [Bradyrhizobium ottawaense]